MISMFDKGVRCSYEGADRQLVGIAKAIADFEEAKQTDYKI